MKIINNLITALLILFSVLFLASCSAKNKEADLDKAQELRQKIIACRSFMNAESEKISPKDATRKREEAQKDARELKKLAEKSTDRAVMDTARGVDEDIVKIKEIEELVICRQKLKDKISGMTLATYRSGRDLMISAVFKAFQIAVIAAVEFPVDKADADKQERVAKSINQAADAGRTITEFLTGNTYADDKEGREKLSADLGALSSKPLPELNLILSLVYLTSGQNDLALFEIENCNPSSFRDTKYLSGKDKLMFFHIIRGWILHSNGWEPLSAIEMTRLETMMADENEMTQVPDIAKRNQTLSFWHLFLAYHYGYEKHDYVKMDQHIAWIIRLNPDSELVSYLTGQKRTAGDVYENVDKSLEKDYAGTEDEAVIKLFAERVRAVRDSAKLEAPPRVATSPRFMLSLAMTITKKYAVKTANSEFMHRLLISVRDFWKVKKTDEKQIDIPPESVKAETPESDVQEIKEP
ncbi:MAG TPA: hypothetical protein DCZ94_06650 [Lentisphaeria bacterium]|nr:MAG: hypothetical protein A2X48_10730 [Lentisphaerae bacterium GWF2_49_21]HBC86614.1 hypothetical protein [Lentisphaeria bacterium]